MVHEANGDEPDGEGGVGEYAEQGVAGEYVFLL